MTIQKVKWKDKKDKIKAPSLECLMKGLLLKC